ncbi:MAG: PEGA domain-containing protein, partial [Candidatus Nomurabacteria bacterium]|nr:PEGA domain-containing protein [Candidatus Nomurabacteria bacterium]
MHKRRTRSQQIAKRFFTYGVMMLLVVLGVALCLTWAMGFRIDWNDGKLTQVALLQFNSVPGGATIDINGEVLPTRTPTRATVKTGETTVIMSLQGYRPWSKTVNMLPSGVVWLSYARLIPDSISTDTTRNFGSIKEIRESPDNKWLLIRHTDNDHCGDSGISGKVCPEMLREGYLAMPFTLTLANIDDPKNVRFTDLPIPSDKITLPTSDQDEKFSIVEWGPNSRFILIKHTVDKITEYLRLDRANPGAVKNLTRDFGMQITEPHFSGINENIFFALTDTNLRKFDYGNNTASAPLVSNVQNYRLFKNGRLAFVSVEKKNNRNIQSVGIYDDGRVTTVQTYLKVEPTLTILVRYNNVDYLAVARLGKVTVYPKPLEKDSQIQPIFPNSLDRIDWLDSSPNGQFILAGSEGRLTSLDLDTKLGYSFEINGVDKAPQWLDNSHIV